MPFNIGSQQAGNINNVDGNQTIYGGQSGYVDPRSLLSQVRRELAGVRMPAGAGERINSELDAVDAELNSARPDKQVAADRLNRAVGAMKSAGVLASAGSGLITALSALVQQFGHLGAPILRLLGL